jgi:hypothetical protein
VSADLSGLPSAVTGASRAIVSKAVSEGVRRIDCPPSYPST